MLSLATRHHAGAAQRVGVVTRPGELGGKNPPGARLRLEAAQGAQDFLGVAVDLHVGEHLANFSLFVHDVGDPLGRAALVADAELVDELAALVREQGKIRAAGDGMLLLGFAVVDADANELGV